MTAPIKSDFNTPTSNNAATAPAQANNLPTNTSNDFSSSNAPAPINGLSLKASSTKAYDPGRKSELQPTMGFQVAARELDRIVVVDVVGRLTLSDSRTQLRDLVHVFTGNGRKKFLINLAGVDYVDSDGLGELTRCYSIVRQAGGEMKLVHVHKKVQALLELTRLINLFEIHTEEHLALQAF